MNGEPNKISADQDPKGVVAKYRNFSKDSHDRGVSHRERDNASEEHFGPPKLRSGNQRNREGFSPIRKRPTQQALIRFAIMAGNAYFEAMPPWHDATTGQADGEKICAGADSLRLLGGKVAQHRFFCISRYNSP